MKDRARELMALFELMGQSLKAGDYAAASAHAHELSSQTTDFRSFTSGFVWNLAEAVPVYGGDVAAARSLVAALDDFTAKTLVPLIDGMAELPLTNAISPVESGVHIDVDTLRSASGLLLDAIPRVRELVRTLDGIGELRVDQLASAVERVREAVSGYAPLLDAAERLLPLLPNLLGADGAARTYLLVAQGNSELRSTGGFPGAVALVDATDGTVTLSERMGVTELMPWIQDDPLEITDEERDVFGVRVSYIPGDMGFIPHLPRVCELWSQCCARSGVPVDGVLTVDPVLLQNVLGLCGPVMMSNGSELNGQTTASLLLRDVYMVYNEDYLLQDAYFSEALDGAMMAILEGFSSLDMGQLASVLVEGARTRRLGAWLVRDEEQAALRGLGDGPNINITNELTQDPARPTAGVYLSNDTWGKIDWWLDAELRVGEPEPLVGGVDGASVPLELRLVNTITYDEVAVAPTYVLGTNPDRRELGDMITQLFLYAPAGGAMSVDDPGSGDISGYAPEFVTDVHVGLQVAHTTLQLLPGESITVRWTVTVTPEAVMSWENLGTELVLDVTPTCQGIRILRPGESTDKA